MPDARRKHYLFLCLALLAFAAMVFLVLTGVERRRQARDFVFGLEELDLLLEDAGIETQPGSDVRTLADGEAVDEASAMIPWLARRAATAGEAMRILKRGYLIYDHVGSADPLDEAAQIALGEFPGNQTLRSIAVFAAVRSGRPRAALAAAREKLGEDHAALYAWALLSNAVLDRVPGADGAEQAAPGDDPPQLLLASLNRQSPADDFERAWRFTGDERYALDATLLLLGDQRADAAIDLALEARLGERWPLLVAGLLVDRARYTEATAILSRLPRSSVEAQLRLADAYSYSGRDADALEIHERLLLLPDPPLESLLGLARASAGGDRAQRLVREAAERYPDSWEAANAGAILAGTADVDLARWNGTEHEGAARLLELRLEGDPERRGYDAALWQLLEDHPSPQAYRYAAWYFAARRRSDEVAIVLERTRPDSSTDRPASWRSFYAGLLAADAADWPRAAAEFEQSFVGSPTWEAALNAAIALYRSGAQLRADARMQDALLLARHASDEARRVAVFIAAARATRATSERGSLIEEALAIDPASPEGLLLAAQLDNPPSR